MRTGTTGSCLFCQTQKMPIPLPDYGEDNVDVEFTFDYKLLKQIKAEKMATRWLIIGASSILKKIKWQTITCIRQAKQEDAPAIVALHYSTSLQQQKDYEALAYWTNGPALALKIDKLAHQITDNPEKTVMLVALAAKLWVFARLCRHWKNCAQSMQLDPKASRQGTQFRHSPYALEE